MNKDITVRLSHDEALVLFEFFWRFQETDDFQMTHNAEFLAFSSIAAQLDKALVEPFQPDYRELLSTAQERIAAGYEGCAPGVTKDRV